MRQPKPRNRPRRAAAECDQARNPHPPNGLPAISRRHKSAPSSRGVHWPRVRSGFSAALQAMT